MYRTHEELTKIVTKFVTDYLGNHPHGLFLVECDGVEVSYPTTQVDDIVGAMLDYNEISLWCMPGTGAAKEIRFDWDHGFEHGGLAKPCILASVMFCEAAIEPFWQAATQ